MNEIFVNIREIVQHPRRVFMKFKEEPRVTQTALVIVVSVLLFWILNPVWVQGSSHPLLAGGNSARSLLLVVVVLSPVACLLCWVISTYILHLLIRLFGHKGQWRALSTCIGYTYVFIPLLLPIEWLDYIAGTGFMALFNSAVSIWLLVLEVLAIRIVYDTSVLKAVFILFLPAILIITLIGAVFYNEIQAVLWQI